MGEKQMISNTSLIREVHSANSVFHFMKEEEFLCNALRTKRLYPRYCIEDISFLDINYLGKRIEKIAVLEKCFCDIKLHAIQQPIRTHKMVGENEEECYLTHTDFYGRYGIAFSKRWGLANGLQPLHYANEESDEIKSFKSVFEYTTIQESVEDIFVDDILYRLCYLKPVMGIMSRNENEQTIFYKKNFLDEREWRFVPAKERLSLLGIGNIIFKDAIQDMIISINNQIEKGKYTPISLGFSYDDIRYLIVPNSSARDSIINYIINVLHVELKEDTKDIQRLISKIIVLSDLEEDW